MTKITKDWVDAYFGYGVDAANRCIFLSDDIDQETVGYVIKGLYLMENMNQDYMPIELRICSEGGQVYDMFALHDVTRTLRSPVHTMGMGKVMSAAVLLVACGKKGERWAGANTSFMIHVPTAAELAMTLHELRVETKEIERLWDLWYALMEKYTNKDAKFWKAMCNKKVDVFFGAEQAQEWGIIDHIWDEKDGE